MARQVEDDTLKEVRFKLRHGLIIHLDGRLWRLMCKRRGRKDRTNPSIPRVEKPFHLLNDCHSLLECLTNPLVIERQACEQTPQQGMPRTKVQKSWRSEA